MENKFKQFKESFRKGGKKSKSLSNIDNVDNVELDFDEISNKTPPSNENQPPSQELENSVVLFIPGLLGTELEDKDGNVVWLPKISNIIEEVCFKVGKKSAKSMFNWHEIKKYFDKKDVLEKLKQIQLVPEETIDKIMDTRTVVKFKVIESLCGITLYQRLINYLTNLGYDKNLYLFPYDWRDSNINTARILSEWILGIIDYNKDIKITLIGHSNGCTVIKWLLAENPDFADNFNKVIYISSPNEGTKSALASILGLGTNIFTSPEQIKKICNSDNFLSITELLLPKNKLNINVDGMPVNFYDTFVSNEDVYEIYKNRRLLPIDINWSNIKRGMDISTKLAKTKISPKFNCISIIGSVYDSDDNINSIDLDTNNKLLTLNKKHSFGDTTIAMDEAIIRKINKRYFVRSSHIKLPENIETLKILDKELRYNKNVVKINKDNDIELDVINYMVDDEDNLKIIVKINIWDDETKDYYECHKINYESILFVGKETHNEATLTYKKNKTFVLKLNNEVEKISIGFLILENSKFTYQVDGKNKNKLIKIYYSDIQLIKGFM